VPELPEGTTRDVGLAMKLRPETGGDGLSGLIKPVG